MSDTPTQQEAQAVAMFDGILGWSNKRPGLEFYHSWEDGRWAKRQSAYALPDEPERGGWGRLLVDDIERSTRGRAEGSDVLVIVGKRPDLDAIRDALATPPVPAGDERAALAGFYEHGRIAGRDEMMPAIHAADAMAKAWADGGWRLSKDYATVERAYERWLEARAGVRLTEGGNT